MFIIFQRLLLLGLLLVGPLLSKGQQLSVSLYHQEIARHRASGDSILKHSEKSPLSAEARASFSGLPYFPIDTAYRVKAMFVRTPQENVFKMPTTTGRLPEYLKYGELHFALQGQSLKLNVYQNQDLVKQPQYLNYLFIPFTDATTGQETYETGRYLDFSIPMGTDTVWLDFNKAYNPYCAYSPAYSCPIPPKENNLPVRVEAGVKTFGEKEKQKSSKGKPKEVMPEYPGGMAQMFTFISRNFKVPKDAKKVENFRETVKVSFVVTAEGLLEDIQVAEPVAPSVETEIKRVIKRMPRWKPGMQNGVPVPVKYSIPIRVSWG